MHSPRLLVLQSASVKMLPFKTAVRPWLAQKEDAPILMLHLVKNCAACWRALHLIQNSEDELQNRGA